MRIVNLISTLFFISALIAASPAHALDLAPLQDEGPSLEDTLKFIKEKINSLKGFIPPSDDIFKRTVEFTNIEIAPDYTVTIKQKLGSGQKYGDAMDHYICDLKTLTSGKSAYSENATLVLHFDSNCKILSGDIHADAHVEHRYPRNPPFYNGMASIYAPDPEFVLRVSKAFNHLAEFMKKMSKKRSNELF